MKNELNAPASTFRLLIPATDTTPPDTPHVKLCGKRWVISEFASIADAPPYTCISYSWGAGRTENMFEDDQKMSDRTIPVIEAAIKATLYPANWERALLRSPRNPEKEAEALSAAFKALQVIWIDALCVPSQDPARSATLRSMGAIYSSAKQVFAVLSEPCSKLLRQIHDTEHKDAKDRFVTGHMNPEELFILEKDDWITRAWTYQETANSKCTYFIAQGDGSVLFQAQDFLDTILTDTTNYADAQGFERAKLAGIFPNLESLQVMIAEHRIVENMGRSVYQVMSAMHQRYAEREDDRIYAMIGVVTDLPSESPEAESLLPAEYFMRACEAKGDYSFIYSIAPRSDVPGRGWRPVSDRMQPVLSAKEDLVFEWLEPSPPPTPGLSPDVLAQPRIVGTSA